MSRVPPATVTAAESVSRLAAPRASVPLFTFTVVAAEEPESVVAPEEAVSVPAPRFAVTVPPCIA